MDWQPPNVQSLKSQARFAFMRGETELAVRLMTEAKVLADAHWSAESEAAFQKYQGKQAP